MLTSIDGKVTGEFLNRTECEEATEIYYEINRKLKEKGSGGFICGRVTMESSFTGGWYPDLSKYEPTERMGNYYMNCRFDDLSEAGYYAIAFDPKGKLGWKSNIIEDSDPGYGGARIIEVLTERVDPRYLTYLQETEIPYILAGEKEIDVPFALDILCRYLRPEFYVLEGGSIINGYFLRADCVDELSLVTAPIVAGKDSKPLFDNGDIKNFELTSAENIDGTLVLSYERKKV